MKTQVIEKTMGNAPKTKNYYSLDNGANIMASVVEVEMCGRIAPHQIAVCIIAQTNCTLFTNETYKKTDFFRSIKKSV